MDQHRQSPQGVTETLRKQVTPSWVESQREARNSELERRRRSLDEMAGQRREWIERMRRDRMNNAYPYTPDYYGWGNPWSHPSPAIVP